MADKPLEDNPERGWGQLLPEYFNDQIKIENHARNGRSTRSFIYEGRWDSVIHKLNKGDFVIIQFGHNDGVETKIGRHTTIQEYRYNLNKFVTDTRNKGANPILCTPIMRRRFNDEGVFYDTHGEYPDVVRDLTEELQIPLVDMHKLSKELIIEHGEERSKDIFLHIEPGVYSSLPEGRTDNTHFSEYGARLMAKLAVQEIKNQNLGLSKYLKDIDDK